MATDAMRAMLDELMGKDRNVPLPQRTAKTVRWDDPSVCKYQICGVCPSRLFKNTKSDLGPCEYEIHDDHLDWPTILDDFSKADPRDVERYERKLQRYLEDLIREMDRKIGKNKERAEKESAPKALLPADQDRLADLKARAKEAMERAEAAAAEGEVDTAHQLQSQAEAYNKQHDEMYTRLTTPDKSMQVCEVCGVFMNSTDNEQRRRDHLEGKQYLGWKAIRERHAQLVAKLSAAGPGSLSGAPRARSADRDYPPPPRTSDRDRDRDRERDREPDRGRDSRDRDRDRRDYGLEYGRDGRDYDRRGSDYRDSRDRYDSGRSSRDRYDRDRDYGRDYRTEDRRRY